MKNKLTALALLTAGALSLAATPVRANDNGLALVGGVLGGLIIASAINDSHHEVYANYTPAYDASCAAPVAYRDDGCWRDVTVQVLVPGCWVEERGFRGHVVRRYVAPHYEARTNRTWVANNRRDFNSHDNRYDRNNHNDRNDRRDNNSRDRNHR